MILKKYLRYEPDSSNKKGEPYGLIVGNKIDGVIKIGWSVCHENDRFDYNKANLIAINRMNGNGSRKKTPDEVVQHIGDFEKRCEKYFK